MITKCPHCQKRIDVSVTASGGYPKPTSGPLTLHSTSRTPFKNDAAVIAPVAPGYQQESQSATFLPTTEANVIVPFLQAVITGVFIGVPVGLLVGLIDVKLDTLVIRGSIGSGLLWGAATLFIVTFWQWISRSGEYNNLLWRIETTTGMDVNGDEEVGQPEPRTIQVEVDNGKSKQWEELPGDEAALIEFAKSIISGRVTFSEDGAAATGYGVTNFRKLRDKFFKHHWAEWKDPKARNQGITLYRAGRTVLLRIAETPIAVETEAGMSNQFVEKGTGKGSWG